MLRLADDAEEGAVTVSVDESFAIVGDFGPYQKRHYFIVASAWVPCALVTLSTVFVNSHPAWRSPPLDAVSTDLVPCGHPFQIVDKWRSVQGEWDLLCDRVGLSSVIDSCFFLGFGIGSMFLGRYSDKAGRRRGCLISTCILSACTLCGAAAPAYWLYVVLRLGSGIGVGGLAIGCYVLGQELVGPSYQAWTGVGQSIIFALGAAILAPIAYLIPGWRALTAVTGLVGLVYVPVFLRVDESPGWLASVGDVARATHVIRAIARGNSSPGGNLTIRGTSLPAASGGGASSSGTSSSGGGGVAAAGPNLFRGSLLRYLISNLVFWFSTSFTYYGLSLSSDNLEGSIHVTFALMCLVEVPADTLGAWLLDRIGRRPTLVGCYVLTAVSCLLSMVLPPGLATTTVVITGKFAIAAAFACIFVYASELFPTAVRSQAMGLCSASGRLGGITAPFVVQLSSVGRSLPFVIFGLSCAAAALCFVRLPETAGAKGDQAAGRPRGRLVALAEVSDLSDDAIEMVGGCERASERALGGQPMEPAQEQEQPGQEVEEGAEGAAGPGAGREAPRSGSVDPDL